jgi:hypothetical protein
MPPGSLPNQPSPDEGGEHMDVVDLLTKLALFGCFVIFGVCLLLIKRQRDKQKTHRGESATRPRIPDA